MIWTTQHDIALCREILVIQPFQFKIGSRERGQSWDKIAESLNAMNRPMFSVDQRAVRDRFSKLEKFFRRKTVSEERASGISPTTTELDDAIENIIEVIDSAKILGQEEDEKRRKKANEEREKAESERKRSMESLSETRERESSAYVKKKRRISGTDAVDYLRVKNEHEMGINERKLQLKEREVVVRESALKLREKEYQGHLETDGTNKTFLMQMEMKISIFEQQLLQQQKLLEKIDKQNQAIFNLLENAFKKN